MGRYEGAKVGLQRGMGIAVVFKKENINTATMNSEMILTVLSAFAGRERSLSPKCCPRQAHGI